MTVSLWVWALFAILVLSAAPTNTENAGK